MTYIPRSSSAIPDSAGPIPKLVRKKYTLRVFNILATIAFVVAVAGAGGVYLLTGYAETKLGEARDALTNVSSADDEQRMAEIGLFDSRLNAASVLLENHLAPSRVLAKLEELTNTQVQLTSFAYTYDPGFDAALTFSLSTAELSTTALQRIGYAASPLFSEFTMTNITTTSADEEEDVASSEFSVKADFVGILDTAQLAYIPPAEPVKTPVAPATIDDVVVDEVVIE